MAWKKGGGEREKVYMSAIEGLKDRVLDVLKSHYIEHYFEEMVLGTDIERGKTNLDIF